MKIVSSLLSSRSCVTSFLLLQLTSLPALQAESPELPVFGPIQYPGIFPRVTEAGVESPTFHFDPNSVPKPGNWEAQWISLSKADPAVTSFRKEVYFDSNPNRVIAWVSAHCAYRLYVNGQLVSRGPDDIGHDVATKGSNWTRQWLADTRDLTRYFRQGKNVLAAEVFSRTSPFADRLPAARNGFFFQAEAQFQDQPSVKILSNATWRAAIASGWSQGTWIPLSETGVAQKEIRTLHFNTGLESEGWRAAGFDDSRWETAAPINAPASRLKKSCRGGKKQFPILSFLR